MVPVPFVEGLEQEQQMETAVNPASNSTKYRLIGSPFLPILPNELSLTKKPGYLFIKQVTRLSHRPVIILPCIAKRQVFTGCL
jgi:hypothetical protein